MRHDLSPKQLQVLTDPIPRVTILNGAIRSGKTLASLFWWLFYIANAPTGGELAIIGRTRDTVWRNVIAPLQSAALFAPFDKQVIGNFGAPTVTILGRRVWVIGAADAKAEKTLRGLTLAGAYLDEATTVQEEFFTQLLGRLSVPGARLIATTNPDNPAHWLKRRFLDRLDQLPDWAAWHFTLDDNPSLTDAYRQSLRREFTGLWYRRFIQGEWVAAEGAVYSMWDPDTMVQKADQLPVMARTIGLGLDHGVTNPSAGIVLEQDATGHLWATAEWWLDSSLMQTKPTTAQQAANLAEWLGDRQPEWWFIDPAAAAFKAQLWADGHHRVTAADNDVNYGIQLVATLLGDGLLKIADTCTNLIREIPSYAWDPKATDQGKDTPIKVADHALDALRYVVVSSETLWRRHLPAPHIYIRKEAL